MLPCNCDIKSKVTIVIPTNNDEETIGDLLEDISNQYYGKGTTVIIADNYSSDKTLKIVSEKKNELNSIDIRIIRASSIKNARIQATDNCLTEYIFFIDSDVRLYSKWLFFNAYIQLVENNNKLVSCKLKSSTNSITSSILFKLYNQFQKFLNIKYHFASGAFFCISASEFKRGFIDEGTFEEFSDFIFSQNFSSEDFKILDEYVGKGDKVFKKHGYFKPIKYFIQKVNSIANKKISTRIELEK